jgi:hypothetical protein
VKSANYDIDHSSEIYILSRIQKRKRKCIFSFSVTIIKSVQRVMCHLFLCIFACCVLFERDALFYVICVFCVVSYCSTTVTG